MPASDLILSSTLGRANRRVLAVSCALVLVASSLAAQTPHCPDPAAREFDFWIGDWEIRQSILRPDGTWLELPAQTTVRSALDGCAVIERWEGRVMFFWEGMTAPDTLSGLSVRTYDPATAKWHIHWMDSRAPRFGQPYVGAFTGGRGEFFREWQTPDGNRIGRVTFDGITARAVTWELAVSSDERKSWQTIWVMRMQRR